MYRRGPGIRTKLSVSSWKRSSLIKRIVQDQLNNKQDEINISNEILIEEHRIRLKKQLRSRIKELVKLQKAHSNQWKKWTKKCQNLAANCEVVRGVDKRIFQHLGNANSVNNDRIKQNNNLIEELTKIYKLIPKKEESPALKSKLEQEHKNVEETKRNYTESTKKLTKQQTQLTKQLDDVNTAHAKRGLGKLERAESRRQQKLLSEQLANTNRQITMAKKDHDKAINNYTIKAKIFLEENQQYHKNSLQSIENILQNFVNVLRIESPFANQTTQKAKPSKYSIQSKKQNHSSSTDDDEKVKPSKNSIQWKKQNHSSSTDDDEKVKPSKNSIQWKKQYHSSSTDDDKKVKPSKNSIQSKKQNHSSSTDDYDDDE